MPVDLYTNTTCSSSVKVTDPNSNCCTFPLIDELSANIPDCPGETATITVTSTLNDATQWVLLVPVVVPPWLLTEPLMAAASWVIVYLP